MPSPIHHTFGPHVTLRYALRALMLLLCPWHWRRGASTQMLQQALSASLKGETLLFATGREALLAVLRAKHIGEGDEVIVQAYTCVVVPNAIQSAGALPVYADIDGDTLNLSRETVEALCTARTRAIIVQHTFGIPMDLQGIRTLCSERGIFLIEDCAHVLPDDESSPIGRSGDATILSFGRDKAISGVSGGAAIVRDPETASILRTLEKQAQDLPRSMIARLILYPLIYRKARALWIVGLGKPYLVLCKALRLLVPIVTQQEKHGVMNRVMHRCPNACAALALYSWQHLRESNAHRSVLTQFYIDATTTHGWNVLPSIVANLPLQKFPIFFPNAEALRQGLKKRSIYLDDGWTGCTICPRDTDIGMLGYTMGTDPAAERIGTSILTLPTHPTMTLRQAQRLIVAIEKTLKECKM